MITCKIFKNTKDRAIQRVNEFRLSECLILSVFDAQRPTAQNYNFMILTTALEDLSS